MQTQDSTEQVDIRAKWHDPGPYKVVGFTGKENVTLHEKRSHRRAVELAECYVDDERFKRIKVEGQ